MEPMTLGSPGGSGGSPAAVNAYLPSYLMGEQQTPSHSRANALSPNKQQCAGRQAGYGFGGAVSSPPPPQTEYANSSVLGRRLMYSSHPQLSSPHNTSVNSTMPNVNGTPNAIGGGPPTQGLFDTLQKDRTFMHTSHLSTMSSVLPSTSPTEKSFMGPSYPPSNNANSSFPMPLNSCNVLSPGTPVNNSFNINLNKSLMRSQQYSQPHAIKYSDFWITVFGFPPSAISLILQHFGQCGTIVDKMCPSQNANWIHLRYSSRLECDKAITYNEKVITDNIMIGVTHCKDKAILEKENQVTNIT